MARYTKDPKWIIVRYPAKCAAVDCQLAIQVGERAFYYPESKGLYGTRCGHGEMAACDFNAHRSDEDGY
jgi:hypothetical protein